MAKFKQNNLELRDNQKLILDSAKTQWLTSDGTTATLNTDLVATSISGVLYGDASAVTGVITDHGGLTGLDDNDHGAIYYTETEIDISEGVLDTKIDTTSGTLQAEIDGLTVDHGELTGLSDDDHSQYYNSTRLDTALATFSGTIDHDTINNYASNEHFTEASIDKYTQQEVDDLFLVESGAVALLDTTWNEIANDKSFSYTAEAGSNRMVVVVCTMVSGDPYSTGISATFGGVSMTEAVKADAEDIFRAGVYIWYMLEADIQSGAQDIVITFGAGDPFIYATFYGTLGDVKQEAPYDTGFELMENGTENDHTINVSEDGYVVSGHFAMTSEPAQIPVWFTSVTVSGIQDLGLDISALLGGIEVSSSETDRNVEVRGDDYPETFSGSIASISVEPLLPSYKYIPNDGSLVDTIAIGDPTVSGSFRFDLASQGTLNLDMYNGATWDNKDTWS